MKPNFALYFLNDSVTLLHRTSSGWMRVGSVAFDEPDLDAAMTYLRGSALGLEPRGIFTKLVIPNSEILYTTVDLATLPPGRKRVQIGRALDGLTPYGLEDLVFDWSGTGTVVQVAAIARETLAEAEGFATAHRLNPVSFVASPEPGTYAAEPWFGPTTAAPALLAQGERIERDQDPVRLDPTLPLDFSAPDADAPKPDTFQNTPPLPAVEPAADQDAAPADVASQDSLSGESLPADMSAIVPPAKPDAAPDDLTPHVDMTVAPLDVSEDVSPAEPNSSADVAVDPPSGDTEDIAKPEAAPEADAPSTPPVTAPEASDVVTAKPHSTETPAPAPAATLPESTTSPPRVTPGPEAAPLPDAVRQFAATLTASVIERSEARRVAPAKTQASDADAPEAPFVTVESLDDGADSMPPKPLRGFPPMLEKMPLTVSPPPALSTTALTSRTDKLSDTTSNAESALARALTPKPLDTPSAEKPKTNDLFAPLPEIPRASVLRADLPQEDDAPPTFSVRRAPIGSARPPESPVPAGTAGLQTASGDAPAVSGADRPRRPAVPAPEKPGKTVGVVSANVISAGAEAAAGGARALRQMKQAVTARSGKSAKSGKATTSNALPPRVAGAMNKVIAEATLDPKTPDPSLTPPRNETEAMTVFGARRDPVRGKPRYLGLMLTAVLLVILVAAAVWATYFLEEAPQGASLQPTIQSGATVADDAAPSGQVAALPGLAAPAGPDNTPAAPEPDTDAASSTVPFAPTNAGSDQAPDVDTAGLPPAVEAAAEAASVLVSDVSAGLPTTPPATGAAGSAADVVARSLAPEAVDEIFLALGDQDLTLSPAPGQPKPLQSNPDSAPGGAAVLPPFGALYKFDADGNIIPTREGVVTPDGVRLVAGRPPRIPPQRPVSAEAPPVLATAQPAATEEATQSTESTAQAAAPASAPVVLPALAQPTVPATPGAIPLAATPSVPEAPPEPDPRLAGARPRARPAGLAPAAAPQAPTDQEGALATDTAVAAGLNDSPRPRVRTASVAAAAAAEEAQARLSAQQQATAAAAAAAAASTAALEVRALQNASLMAVAISRKPAVRPRNFETTVVAAVAAAPRTAAARAAPSEDVVDDHEPEVTRAAPAIPTRASVAKQATLARAINLNRLNLIGVYGTSSSRYALVRTSSGRYERVKVGDRLDGGQVSAITQTELRYSKRGQQVKLEMPKG
ncbi:MAG: hypothetical protein Q7J57_16210 [Gemmobacter sp.]|nr:hypothetical protein [Gemmobacter sp.]